MKMSEQDWKKQFIEMLDEVNETVEVCQLPFDVSEILEKCDPVAFRQMMLDQADAFGVELE